MDDKYVNFKSSNFFEGYPKKILIMVAVRFLRKPETRGMYAQIQFGL